MTPDALASWDCAVPRYTSYPTVPAWGSVTSEDVSLALQRCRPGAHVYVHLPFCEQQCSYCGCNMVQTRQRGIGEVYLDVLERRLDALPLPAGRMPMARFHLGGGTPTWFSADQLARLHAMVLRRFVPTPDASLSLEADPEATSVGQLERLAELGFTRLSLGVQSTDERVLRAVDRPQSERRLDALIQAARGLGYALNLDLMLGLPHQDHTSVLRTLLRVKEWRPDRIALFGYAHMPHLKPNQRRIDGSALPDAIERARTSLEARDYLVEQGWVPVGTDHFALPTDDLATGTVRRNFMGYYPAADADLVGLGVSAISHVDGLFFQQSPKLMDWMRDATPVRGWRMTPDDRRRGDVIEALMCGGVAVAPDDLLSSARPHLTPLIEGGLASLDGNTVHVLEPLLARLVAATFDSYRTAGRFSQAV